jgi:hypothetical protein
MIMCKRVQTGAPTRFVIPKLPVCHPEQRERAELAQEGMPSMPLMRPQCRKSCDLVARRRRQHAGQGHRKLRTIRRNYPDQRFCEEIEQNDSSPKSPRWRGSGMNPCGTGAISGARSR